MTNGTAAGYRFGDFVLNVERGCLQIDGQDLALRPKAFDILRFLVERAGKLASKDELVELAWPNVTVSDDSLAQCVKEIRRLLGDDEQRFIRTVPRRGYMFVAEVKTLDSVDTAIPVKVEEQTWKRQLPVIGRWHFGSFAAGFLLTILILSAWLGTTKAMVEPAFVPRASSPP